MDKAWGGCPALLAAVEQVRNQPRTMAQPVIASGPADRLLSVYIEDGTPTSDNTTPLVRARFWNDEAGIWGAPATLSDGLHYVTEPSAAFVGPDGKAVVVWIENTLTRTQGAALGTDLSAILSHQEIFYSVWDGAAWSSPQQFTIDSLADANPAIAGDLGGNATLAWVKDTDGDIATRSDLEIMTSDLTIVAVADERRIGERQSAALTWQAPRAMASMLKRVEKVTADSYMDVQPGVIRTDDPDMPVAITWTRDLDGEPATNGDRNVTVAMQGRTGWVEIPPSDPPPGWTPQRLAGIATRISSIWPFWCVGRMVMNSRIPVWETRRCCGPRSGPLRMGGKRSSGWQTSMAALCAGKRHACRCSRMWRRYCSSAASTTPRIRPVCTAGWRSAGARLGPSLDRRCTCTAHLSIAGCSQWRCGRTVVRCCSVFETHFPPDGNKLPWADPDSRP